MMARTIATKKQIRDHATTFYPDCVFTQQDEHGRTLKWEMARVQRLNGTANGWRFFVPTILGYRKERIELNKNEYIPYLLATEEEIGTRTVVETLTRLHRAQPQRTLQDALPAVAAPPPAAVATAAAADDDTLAEVLPEAIGVPVDEDLDTPEGLYAAVQTEL